MRREVLREFAARLLGAAPFAAGALALSNGYSGFGAAMLVGGTMCLYGDAYKSVLKRHTRKHVAQHNPYRYRCPRPLCGFSCSTTEPDWIGSMAKSHENSHEMPPSGFRGHRMFPTPSTPRPAPKFPTPDRKKP